MRREPIEVPVLKNKRAAHREISRHFAHATISADIVDEAFAELPISVSEHQRVDPPTAAIAMLPTEHERASFGILALEVAALNRRCEHLSHLLCGRDPAGEVR
jgi:hypothetical protein